ncbi:MAG: DUF4238 domain-containing protein [Syntrophales bacterium]|nr:DUF4238 domain-containing protein [Syntrophales bacterium]
MKQIDASTPKKQHYVPQFILKNFTSGIKKHIYTFDKHRNIFYISAVHETACEKGFYNIRIKDLGLTIENKLACLETASSRIITKIVEGETLSGLSKSERLLLSLFCAVQFLRTSHIHEEMQEMQDNLVKWTLDQGLDVSQIENFEILSKTGLKQNHVNIINSMAMEISTHFHNKILLLKKAPPGHQFLISDNPITMHNYKPRPGRGNLGLALEGIEIHVPISSKLSLTYICPRLIDELLSKIKKYSVLKILRIAFPTRMDIMDEFAHAIQSGDAHDLDPENVEFHNSLQVIHSSRFIFSARNDFSLVQDMLQQNPALKKPSRFGLS